MTSIVRLTINRRLVGVAALLGGLILFGTLGYILIERWTWRDALFMTIITISTVGYGEEVPLSDRGELFTMILIFLGVGSAAYTFTNITNYIIAGELRGVLRRQRMMRNIERMENHFIVCGYGRVGRQVVEELRESGVEVVVIDSDAELSKELEELAVYFVIGSATEDETLERAGIRKARGLSSCLPQDANNVFVVLSARSFNPDLTIIARSNLIESAPKLLIAGANQIINPYLITGRRMASELIHPTVVEFLDVVMRRGQLELRIEELTIGEGSTMDGRTLADCDVRGQTGVNVLAVQPAGGRIHTEIGPTSV